MPAPDPQTSGTATSREHVSRIDRGYYRATSRFQRLRHWLIVAGIVVSVAWCAWGAFDAPRHHAPGPVAVAHAKWEHDCVACHVPFSPIKDGTWLTSTAARATLDAKCESCHRGPRHHPLEVPADVGSCASCHADHRGRGADLSRVTDRTCTACHADIAAHRLPGGTPPPSEVATPITRFDDEHHPGFASLASDPGRLRFSHGRHMRAGLSFGSSSEPPGGRDGARPWTYRMLPAGDRGRYQPPGAAAEDLVQLSCASCHEFAPSLPPDESRTVSGAVAAAAPGAYALPLQFERHCGACHLLPYDGVAGPAADGIAMLRPDAVLPHGLEPGKLAAFLESRFLEEALRDEGGLLDDPRPRRPLPAARTESPEPARLRTLIRDRVERAVAFTRGTCEKCHTVGDAAAPDFAGLLRIPDGDTTGWFAVAPVQVPEVWLKKARFDHRPHRGYDCRQCHAAAYPDDAPGSSLPVGSPLDNGIVMISGRESCTACHAPAGHDPATGKPVGGARFDCVECHGYHGLGPHQAGTLRSPAVGPGPSTPAAAAR